MVLLKSEKDSGIVFVDTMNLDGEVIRFYLKRFLKTNLKEKMAAKEIKELEESHILQSSGSIVCDSPNEFLDRWDGNITMNIMKE
jgi:hypothetical protein